MAIVNADTDDNPMLENESTSSTVSESSDGPYTSAFTVSEDIDVSHLLAGNAHGGGVNTGFISDIYQEERQTPHNEMKTIRDMILRNAFANTAVDTVADLLLGKYQRIVSPDEETQEWFTGKWLPQTNVLDAMSITAHDFIGFGNFYIEKRNGPGGYPKMFDAIAHPERVWKQITNNTVTGYVLEIPRQQVTDEDGFKRFKVGYGQFHRQSVYGVQFDPDELEAGRLGQGDFRFYGRSPLASTISDHKILKEIERSMAVFSRYKSVPKKLISTKNAEEQPLSSSSFNEFLDDWRQLSDMENMVANGKNFDVHDLDYSGNQVDFQQMIDYFKRKITSTLIPEFYLHGENTTHAVSNSQESTFMLRMESWRQQFLKPWNQILKQVAREKGLSEDVEFELGPFNVETDQQKREKALKAYQAGTITVDEMRDMIGLEPAEDENVGRSYNWELQEQPSMQPLQQKLDKIASDVED